MFRALLLLIITGLFHNSELRSQILDNFSDGDFSQNPAWSGDANAFIVNTSGELQLNAPAAGTSMLSVQGNIPDSAIWDLDFRMVFAPSSQNYLRIYLLCDQANFATCNGYFLEMGETGSQDAIRMYRQDAGVKTLLAIGQAALVASNPNLHLKMVRSVSGQWTLEAAQPSGALQPQFTFTDATYGGGLDRFFGFQCVYTSSNTGNFHFDNISIVPDLPDTTPPQLSNVSVINANQILLVFNEDLNPSTANDPSHYQISGGVGQPFSAVLQGDNKTVVLTLSAPLATGAYTLTVSAIEDLAGNESSVQSRDFQYINVEPADVFDIIVNEIMADPSPSSGLPEVEWLEILNRSSKIIDLSTLRISDNGSAPQSLPATLLYPGRFAVLTPVSSVATMLPVSSDTVLGITLSSTALNNEGDVLTLSTGAGLVVDRVSYTSEWHTEDGKDEGGWSLERINPELPCLGQDNWRSCPSLPGGTPGKKNAAYDDAPDTKQPHALFAIPESSTEIILTFTEGLDYTTALQPERYQLTPARQIASIQPATERLQLRLLLTEPLQAATVYIVSFQNTLLDCKGNALVTTDTILTGLPEKPDFQDIVINEILFNPPTGGSRYVELLNRSNKIFRWSEFFVANFNNTADTEPLTTMQLSLPGKYHVFTSDRNFVLNNYQNIHPRDVIRQNLPSLADDVDNFTLYWAKNGETITIDSLDYTDDWHNALFSSSDKDGVALERIRVSEPTNLRSNWTSASPLLTGAPGTPTLPNSQRLGNVPDNADDLLQLISDRISPDDDGYEDFAELQYRLPEEGYEANFTIFDAGGMPVRKIVKYQLIGTEGTVRWDGESDEGTRVRPGIYILFVELFNANGEVKNFKRTISVVRRF
ncbi:MAG: lamin tail domain-containing protein [Bacteroidetes bacterium]|nr:lamin tail domain-containing protein [Bacteroidota bacterium]